jgi:cob(I)alamin adenosyltransferase
MLFWETYGHLIETALHRIQNDLFIMGAELATPVGSGTSILRIDEAHVAALEKIIDQLEETLPPLKEFILPSGSIRGTQLHLARTVCRRTERQVVSLSHSEQIEGHIIIYLNRLSDLLFVTARYENLHDRMPEEKWEKPE